MAHNDCYIISELFIVCYFVIFVMDMHVDFKRNNSESNMSQLINKNNNYLNMHKFKYYVSKYVGKIKIITAISFLNTINDFTIVRQNSAK